MAHILLTESSTYPSVYVAFETIAASNLCGRVGTIIDGIATLAFDASDLSTATSYSPVTSDPFDQLVYLSIQNWWTYSGIDFQTRCVSFPDDLDPFTESLSVTCTNVTTTLWTRSGGYSIFYPTSAPLMTLTWGSVNSVHGQHITRAPGSLIYTLSASDFQPFPVIYNPCTPFLSVPSQIVTIDPLWSTCYRDFKGLHDPPKIMDSSNGFLPVISKSGSRTNDAPVTPKISESPEETQGPQARPAIPQPVVTQTPSPGTPAFSDGRLLFASSEIGGTGPETRTLAVGGPAETIDGIVLSLISGSGGESLFIEGGSGGSITEDIGALTSGGLETLTTSSSVGAVGADGGGTILTSESAKMEIGVLITWQIAFYHLLTRL